MLARDPILLPGPQQPGAHYWQQGKFDQAVAHVQQVIALRPDYAQAHFNLGNLLRTQRQLDQAQAHY